MNNANQVTQRCLLVLTLLVSCFAIEGQAKNCEEFMERSEKERAAYLSGWISGVGMINQDQRLNAYSKRTQMLVEDRKSNAGPDWK